MTDKDKRIERLEAALQGLMERGDFWIAVAQAGIALPGEVDDCTEALADDGAEYDPYGAQDATLELKAHAGPTPPGNDARGKALANKLHDIAHAKPGFIAADTSQVAVDRHYWFHVQNTAMAAYRALTNPAEPAVPEAVRRLPEWMRRQWDDCRPEVARVANTCAGALEDALAQHGGGRVPEGFRCVGVTKKGFDGCINLFFNDYFVGLVPPPYSIEIHRALNPEPDEADAQEGG